MIRIILLVLALSSVHAFQYDFPGNDIEDIGFVFQSKYQKFMGFEFENQEKISNAQDIIDKLKSLMDTQPPPAYTSQVELLIRILETPGIRKIVDKTLEKHPELPSIIRGIRIFLTGPQAAPLIGAVQKVLVPSIKALQILYESIAKELEKAGETLSEQGVRLFFLLQQPDVIEVIQKFQALPEVIKLAELLEKENGADLLGGLKALEEILSTGISIPT